MSNAKIFIKSILVPVILGSVVGFLISSFIDYSSLQKPFLAPPSIVFPIVWTILYILMGVSYGILKTKKLVNQDIDFIYYLQLGFNLLWSIIFFILKWRLLAFFWIIALAIFVFIMVIRFYDKDKTAGLLQIPYFIWVIFATYLNFGFYILNN